MSDSASAIAEFLAALQETGSFSPELAQKIVIAATPVIVAIVATTAEGNQ